MKLDARARLSAQEAESVSYEQWRLLVAGLDPSKVQAFDFKLPSGLKKLWSELKEVANELKDAAGIGLDAVIKAFQERSVFTLLKGLGFSLKKLLKAVIKASALPAHTVFAAFDALIEAFGDSALLQRMDVHERVAKLDAVIKRHPILTKVTGAAVAGFLIWQYLHTSNTGDVHYDLSLVDTILNCIRGDYSLADMFASKQGLRDISVLLFGLTTGGMGLTSYGASHVESVLKFLGQHSSQGAAILIALFYAAARKIGLHIDYSHEPAAMRAALTTEPPPRAGRTHGWFHRLTPAERQAYVKKFPGTKFHQKTIIIPPESC